MNLLVIQGYRFSSKKVYLFLSKVLKLNLTKFFGKSWLGLKLLPWVIQGNLSLEVKGLKEKNLLEFALGTHIGDGGVCFELFLCHASAVELFVFMSCNINGAVEFFLD